MKKTATFDFAVGLENLPKQILTELAVKYAILKAVATSEATLFSGDYQV